VDPRAGLDGMEQRKFLTLPELELRPLGRPAHSQSLYRLRYPGSLIQWTIPKYVGFEVPRAGAMKSSIFLDISQRSSVNVDRRFGGRY
jgi:hypothetical protein